MTAHSLVQPPIEEIGTVREKPIYRCTCGEVFTSYNTWRLHRTAAIRQTQSS